LRLLNHRRGEINPVVFNILMRNRLDQGPGAAPKIQDPSTVQVTEELDSFPTPLEKTVAAGMRRIVEVPPVIVDGIPIEMPSDDLLPAGRML